MTLEKAIRQIREDVLNARECEDDTVEVPVDALEAVLAEIERLAHEASRLRDDLDAAESEIRVMQEMED